MSTETSPSRWKVLIIGRDVADAEACLRMLNAIGHWGYATDSASDALTLWAGHGNEFDIVICDAMLSDMRGPELEVRMRERGVNPRILFIGGTQDDAKLIKAHHRVMPKPFTPASLHMAIHELMNRA